MLSFPLQNLPSSSEFLSRSDDKNHPVHEHGSRSSDENVDECAVDRGVAQHNLVLLQSIRQSRHFYTTRLLPTFRSSTNPPDPVPPPHTLRDLGSASVLIGPCQFNQCTLYQVQYVSDSPGTNLDRTSNRETMPDTHLENGALGNPPFDELGWLNLEQVGELSEVDSVALNREAWTDASAIQADMSSGRTERQDNSKSGEMLGSVRLRGGATDEENLRFTPTTDRQESETFALSEKSLYEYDKPNFTPELKKAIQLTATLEGRLAELLHKTNLEQIRGSELMELNRLMKSIEFQVTSGTFNWGSMLSEARNAQRLQWRKGEQTKDDHREQRDKPTPSTAFTNQRLYSSPSPSVTFSVANLDDQVQSSRPIEAIGKKFSSAPMLWSRSSPRWSATPEARHRSNRQFDRLSATPTRLITSSTPARILEPAGMAFQITGSLDYLQYQNLSVEPEPDRGPVGHGLSLVKQIPPPSVPRPLPNRPLVNEVVMSFAENPDEIFLIPLSRSIISRDPIEQGESIRISFFTPTPSTTLPPLPLSSRLGASENILQDQRLDNSDLVRLEDRGNGDDERTDMMTIVIENYSEDVWEALENSYTEHLRVIFEGTDGREERVSEFQSMLHRGLPPSPPPNVATTPLNEIAPDPQIDEESQQVDTERRDQEAKFFRDEAARVYFETYGEWPDDYVPPFTFEELEELRESLENVEDSEIPAVYEDGEEVRTSVPTAITGGRAKKGATRRSGRGRKKRRQKKEKFLSSEEDSLPENPPEFSGGDVLVIPTHSRPKRRIKTPDYIIRSDRTPTPLTPPALSSSDEDSSEVIVVARSSSQSIASSNHPSKAINFNRRAPTQNSSNPKRAARRRATEPHEPYQSHRNKSAIQSTSTLPRKSLPSRVYSRKRAASRGNASSTLKGESKNRIGDSSDLDDSDLLIM